MMLDWWMAYLATGIGLVGGTVGALRLRPDKAATSHSREDRLEDIDERLEQLTAQLAELEEQKQRLTEEAYQDQRRQTEKLAATLLREREALSAVQVQSEASAQEPTTQGKGSQLKGFVWGAGVAGVIGFLMVSVTLEQQPRGEGGSLTGNTGVPGSSDGAGTPTSPEQSEMMALMQRLQQDPKDMEATLALIRHLLRAQMFDSAQILIDRALQLEPNNPTAQVYWAVLEAAKGQVPQAIGKLDAILKEHPNLADGWFFRGMLGMQSGDQELMRHSFERFVATAPEGPQRDRVQAMLGESASE